MTDEHLPPSPCPSPNVLRCKGCSMCSAYVPTLSEPQCLEGLVLVPCLGLEKGAEGTKKSTQFYCLHWVHVGAEIPI